MSATRHMEEALRHLCVFFERVDCMAPWCKMKVTFYRPEDAQEVSEHFATAGWHVEVDGRVMHAYVASA